MKFNKDTTLLLIRDIDLYYAKQLKLKTRATQSVAYPLV